MKKLKIVLQSNIFYILLIFTIILNIFIRCYVIKYSSNINNLNSIVGIVTDIKYEDDKISFILNSSEKVKCVYYIDDYKEDLLGKKIIVRGSKQSIRNNTIPNTFNYKKYLYNNHIYLAINVSNIEIINNENIFYKIKKIIINRIKKIDDNKASIYLNMFILGNKDNLNNDLYNVYKNNGINHLFAISGMHLGLLLFTINFIFKKFKYKNIITLIFLSYFIFITNFSPSVLRVSLYFFVSMISKKININISSLKKLLITASILLLINPFFIFDVGFLYSFTITFYLLLNSNNIKGSYIKKTLYISFISFLAGLPITISLNYEINILSIILNIIYVPFVSFILFPFALLTFIFPFLKEILIFLINILEYSNLFFYKHCLNMIIPKINIIFILLYYLIFIFKSKNKYIFIISILLFSTALNYVDKSMNIYYFDVSQGDSSLITNKKETILIDTGGNILKDSNFSNNIIMFMKSKGITKIDNLILSHGGV